MSEECSVKIELTDEEIMEREQKGISWMREEKARSLQKQGRTEEEMFE